jgi:uncharacterized protein YkwD
MPQRHLVALAIALALAAPAYALDSNDMATAVVDAMNAERATHGLAPLHIDPKLVAAASDRLSDMFDGHYFAHRSPTGLQPWQWVEQEGYSYHDAGENLAVGYPSASSIVDGWMHSPGHRANVLGGQYVDVGVAVAPGSPTHDFIGPTVVAIYGSR